MNEISENCSIRVCRYRIGTNKRHGGARKRHRFHSPLLRPSWNDNSDEENRRRIFSVQVYEGVVI